MGRDGCRAGAEGVLPTLPGLLGPWGSGLSVGQRWGRVARVHRAGAPTRREVGELAMRSPPSVFSGVVWECLGLPWPLVHVPACQDRAGGVRSLGGGSPEALGWGPQTCWILHACPLPPFLLAMTAGRNPCADRNGGCMHRCRALRGLAHCECRAGYQLAVDRKACEGKTPSLC